MTSMSKDKLKLSEFDKLNPHGYKLRLWPLTREFRRWGKQEYDNFIDKRCAIGETKGNENENDLSPPAAFFDSEFDQPIQVWNTHPWYKIAYLPEDDDINSQNKLYKGLYYYYNDETGETLWEPPSFEWKFALESWGHFTPRKLMKEKIKPDESKYSLIFDKDTFVNLEDWRLRETSAMMRERKLKESKAAITIDREKKRKQNDPTPEEQVENVIISMVDKIEKNLIKRSKLQLIANYFDQRKKQCWHPSTIARLMAPLPLGGQCEIITKNNRWVPKRLITDVSIPPSALILNGGYVIQCDNNCKEKRETKQYDDVNSINSASKETPVSNSVHLSVILNCHMPPHVEYRKKKVGQTIKTIAVPRRNKYLKNLQLQIAKILSLPVKCLILEESSPYEEEIKFNLPEQQKQNIGGKKGQQHESQVEEHLLPNAKDLFVSPPKILNIKKRMGLLGEGKQEFFNNYREKKNKFRFHMIQATSLPNSSHNIAQQTHYKKLPKLPSYCENDVLIFEFNEKKKNHILHKDQNSTSNFWNGKWPIRVYNVKFIILDNETNRKGTNSSQMEQIQLLLKLKTKIENIILFLTSKNKEDAITQANYSAYLNLLKSILRMEIKAFGIPLKFSSWEEFWMFHINPIFFGYDTSITLRNHYGNLASQLQNPKFKRTIGIRKDDSTLDYDEEELQEIKLKKEINSAKYATSKNAIYSVYAQLLDCQDIEHLKPKWGKTESTQWIDEVKKEKQENFLNKQASKDLLAEQKRDRQRKGKRQTNIRKFFSSKIIALEEEKRAQQVKQGKLSKQVSIDQNIAIKTEPETFDEEKFQHLSFSGRVKAIRNQKNERNLKEEKFFEYIYDRSNHDNDICVERENIKKVFAQVVSEIDAFRRPLPASIKVKRELQVPFDSDIEVCYTTIKDEQVLASFDSFDYKPEGMDKTHIDREMFIDFMKCSIAFYLQLEKIKQAEEMAAEMARQKQEKLRKKEEERLKIASKKDKGSISFLQKIRPAHSHVYLTKYLGLDYLGRRKEEIYCALCRRQNVEKTKSSLLICEKNAILDFDLSMEDLKDSLFPLAVEKTKEMFLPPSVPSKEVFQVLDSLAQRVERKALIIGPNPNTKRMNKSQRAKLVQYSISFIEEYAQTKRERLLQDRIREEYERRIMFKEELEGRSISEKQLILHERPALLHQERSFKFYNSLFNQLPTVDPSLERMSWIRTLSRPEASNFVYHVRDRVCDKEYIVRVIGIEGNEILDAEKIMNDLRKIMTIETSNGVTKITRALKHKVLNFSMDGFVSRDMNYIFINEEYCSLGRAVDVAKKELLPAEIMYNLTRDLVIGLSNLHQSGVFHRELTPSCIYLNDKYQAKIGSFRLWTQSDLLRHSSAGETTKDYGIEWILPPDHRYGDPVEASCDVWALGCCIFSIATGGSFPTLSDIPLGILNKLPCNYAQEVRDVIIGCLEVNSRIRPTAHQLRDIFDPLKKLRKNMNS